MESHDKLLDEPRRKMYRPTRIAEEFDVSRAKIYNEIKSGKLAAIRVGGQLRVTHEALQEWVEAQQQEEQV